VSWVVRGLLVSGLLGLGWLAVFRAPHGALWKPAVAATEWGHVLALAALALAVPWGQGRVHAGLSGLALLAAALLSSPVLRATAVGPVRATGLWSAGIEPGPVRTERLAGERRVDLYGTGSGSRRPVVIAVHGGSWNSGDRTQLPGVYHWLAARGWAVAAIEYPLAPAHRWPAQADALVAARAWLVDRADELGLDPARVVWFGRSAGGHLALHAAYTQPGVLGVVALYPPTDLRWSWEHPTSPWVLDTPGTLLGLKGPPGPGPAPDTWDDASPLHHVRAGAPATLLVHGGRDELVFAEQSDRLAAALRRVGTPVRSLRLPWATHGCDANLAGPSGQLYLQALARFLDDLPGGDAVTGRTPPP
jgi:acetyl esterase/lipase